MNSIDMDHMKYIEQVSTEDAIELRHKEGTYQGSWKKRGGVGAAMMLLRKSDRLEVMLENRSYDIFKNPGDGSDGTLIAEIRDLRRYLLLVEAELMARGEVRYSSGGPVSLSRDAHGGPVDVNKPALSRDYDDGISADDLGTAPRNHFISTPHGLIVNRDVVPLEGWEHLPMIDRELNYHEWTLQPKFYQWLYTHDAVTGKYILDERYRANWEKQI